MSAMFKARTLQLVRKDVLDHICSNGEVLQVNMLTHHMRTYTIADRSALKPAKPAANSSLIFRRP